MLAQMISEELARILSLKEDEVERLLEIPPQETLGDLAFPCFTLAKTKRKAPPFIAAELEAAFLEHKEVTAKATGGYVNFFFHRETVAGQLFQEMKSNQYWQPNSGDGKRVVIDMSSPNIAKPFGIGHLRSTIIGHALYHLLKKTGYDPIRVNHLGDWGTQFGKQIAAYQRWGGDVALKQNPIASFLELYVRFHEEAEKDESLEDEGREWFKKLEEGDQEADRLWTYFVKESLNEFDRMYNRLGVEFDYVLGESFYNDQMAPVVKELQEKGLLTCSEGALVVPLEDADLPPCLIVKSDGTSIYATRDLATAIYRHHVQKGEKLLYVVGGEQTLHFKQVFHVLKKMGYKWADQCEHISFGLLRLDGKKMSTRRGRVVMLEDVLNDVVAHAKAKIKEKHPNHPHLHEVAEAVGVGAVIFGDLKQDRRLDVNFRLEDALSFEGETGPYVQYTYARIQSILRRGDKLNDSRHMDWQHVTNDEGWSLLKVLIHYPNVLIKATEAREPHQLARYVLTVSKKFNQFYHKYVILADDETVRQARLILAERTGEVIADAMAVLGVKTPEEL